MPPQARVLCTCSCAHAFLCAVVPVLVSAPVPCTCTMARPVLFSPYPYPGLPPMAGLLKDFRTSRVASRRRLFPAPDALRSPRSCSSRSHAHARSSLLRGQICCATKRGALRSAFQSRPGPMPQSVLVPARRGSKGLAMEKR